MDQGSASLSGGIRLSSGDSRLRQVRLLHGRYSARMMMQILTYLPDPLFQARLRAALEFGSRLDRCVLDDQPAESWDDLLKRASGGVGMVIVIDPYRHHELYLSGVGRLRMLAPAASIIAYGDFRPSKYKDVFQLALTGIQEIIGFDTDDTKAALYRTVSGGMQRTATARVSRKLQAQVPPSLYRIIRPLLECSDQPATPTDAARLLFCHPKTLRTRLRQAGLPTTERLLVWLRILHAAAALHGASCSVDAFAIRAGFASGNTFRNQLRRYAGLTVKELDNPSGFDRVLQRFLDDIASPRHAVLTSED